MSFEGRTTSLGEAFARYKRIFKTMHLLQFLHDESYRRMIGAQLNITEGRHRWPGGIFLGNLGELRQAYQLGMEDQRSALGLGLNCVDSLNRCRDQEGPGERDGDSRSDPGPAVAE